MDKDWSWISSKCFRPKFLNFSISFSSVVCPSFRERDSKLVSNFFDHYRIHSQFSGEKFFPLYDVVRSFPIFFWFLDPTAFFENKGPLITSLSLFFCLISKCVYLMRYFYAKVMSNVVNIFCPKRTELFFRVSVQLKWRTNISRKTETPFDSFCFLTIPSPNVARALFSTTPNKNLQNLLCEDFFRTMQCALKTAFATRPPELLQTTAFKKARMENHIISLRLQSSKSIFYVCTVFLRSLFLIAQFSRSLSPLFWKPNKCFRRKKLFILRDGRIAESTKWTTMNCFSKLLPSPFLPNDKRFSRNIFTKQHVFHPPRPPSSKRSPPSSKRL